MVVVMENGFGLTFLKTSRDEYPKDVYMFVLK
jgi:hypothetical protein